MCDTVQQYAESYAEKVRKVERECAERRVQVERECAERRVQVERECAERRGKEERQRLLRSLQILLTSGVPMQNILVAFPQLSSEEIAGLKELTSL